MIRYKSTKQPFPVTLSGKIEWEVTPDVIVWDGGNGRSSAWRLYDDGLQSFSLPNVRVPVTGYSLNSDVTSIGTSDMVYADVRFGGTEQRYGIGEGIWNQTVYQPQTLANTPDRYGSDMHIFMLLCLLAILDAPQNVPLTVVVSAPPSLVNQVAKPIKKALKFGQDKDKTGRWDIRMSFDKAWRTYHIDKVIVVPEGQGAYSAYAYDANGEDVQLPSSPGKDDDLLSGNVHIHDAGHGTYDSYIVRHGKIEAESIARATDDRGGVLEHMIDPIKDFLRDYFHRQGLGMPRVSDIEVDFWLTEWAKGKMRPQHAIVKINGRQLDLAEAFTARQMYYADYVNERVSRSFRQGADTILAVGGGWVYVVDDIKKRHKNMNILTPDDVPHLKNIPLWELNAYGGLPMIAANKRINRKVAG